MEDGGLMYKDMPKWMEVLDFFFNKVLPKKFIVVVLASIYAFMGILTGGQWLIIAGAYAGINYGQKVLERLSNGRNDNRTTSPGDDVGTSGRRVHLDAQESREAAQ